VTIVAMTRIGVHCDFAELPLLKARMKDLQADVEHESFGADGVTLELRLPDSQLTGAELLVSDVTRGRSTAKRLD
jgi:putative IMPACT (imprinted ancient) family translation regulator